MRAVFTIGVVVGLVGPLAILGLTAHDVVIAGQATFCVEHTERDGWLTTQEQERCAVRELKKLGYASTETLTLEGPDAWLFYDGVVDGVNIGREWFRGRLLAAAFTAFIGLASFLMYASERDRGR